MFIPSKMFCCEERADLNALPNLITNFLRLSSISPWLFIQRATLLRQRLYDSLVLRESRYCFMPPTERSIDMLLSLSIISRLLGDDETLFSPSNASPPDIEPSPMTATTWRL